jgi:hypothetical protein
MLYCISANYTPKAMQAMAKKPDSNRRDAVEKLVKAARWSLREYSFRSPTVRPVSRVVVAAL